MKRKLYLGIVFLLLFIIWTITLLFVDRKEIGPNNGAIGYATMNDWFHNLTGVNWLLYNLTDFGGIPPIILGIVFGVLGLIQWIKRKSIKRVDRELIILGIFYIVVFAVYLLFEIMVINRRPVLINEYLEASYPSSTTFLSITFMLSMVYPIKKYVTNNCLKRILIILAYLYMGFLIIGRAMSGVHWLSDIIGSMFIGFGLIWIYEYIMEINENKMIIK